MQNLLLLLLSCGQYTKRPPTQYRSLPLPLLTFQKVRHSTLETRDLETDLDLSWEPSSQGFAFILLG